MDGPVAGLPGEGLAVQEVVAEPGAQPRLRQLSAVPSSLAGPPFGSFIEAELQKWGPVVEKAGIAQP